MTVMVPIADVTLRGLLSRRRMVLLVLLAALPVLIGLLIRVAGGRPDPDRVLDTLVVRFVMPAFQCLIFSVGAASSVSSEFSGCSGHFAEPRSC